VQKNTGEKLIIVTIDRTSTERTTIISHGSKKRIIVGIIDHNLGGTIVIIKNHPEIMTITTEREENISGIRNITGENNSK